MIISFNGEEGSGKSTISKMVAKELNFPYYYTGGIFRDIAKRRKMTLSELHKICETDSSVDEEVDTFTKELSKKEKDFVIDSRLAWHFIPRSLKIYLKANENEAAKRIFKELQKENSRNEALNLDSEKKVLINILDRRKKDDKRYLRLYALNLRNEKNYDFVLDTTNLSMEKVFEETMKFIKSKSNAKPD